MISNCDSESSKSQLEYNEKKTNDESRAADLQNNWFKLA